MRYNKSMVSDIKIFDAKRPPAYEKSRVCFFSGNRPQKLPWGFDESNPACIYAKRVIASEIEKLINIGYDYFISGMALGGDMYFAEAVLDFKKRHPIILECALPCKEQSDRWSVSARAEYDRILFECDYINAVSESYDIKCMDRRNRYMAQKSSALIAMDFAKKGGSAKTLAFAKTLGIKIIDITAMF